MSVANGKIITPPDANEEHHIYVQKSHGAKKLRNVDELKDYFAVDNGNWYAWAHTLTGLRFREADLGRPYNVGDKITAEVIETDITPFLSEIADPKFTRESWKDIIDKVNHVKGEIAVPYNRGHVVREMQNGIFTEIEKTTEHRTPFALHGWLRENLDVPQDPVSGHYDVAVGRRSSWHHDEHGRCLLVSANFERWRASSSHGFRSVVRGSVSDGPKIDAEKVRETEKAFLERMREDFHEMAFPEWRRKYNF